MKNWEPAKHPMAKELLSYPTDIEQTFKICVAAAGVKDVSSWVKKSKKQIFSGMIE